MKHFIKHRIKISILLCWVFLLSLCMPRTAAAHTRPELDRQVSVTLSYGFADVDFSMYRVADVSEKLAFTLAGDFAGYQVSLENLDSEGWRAAAQTLDAYATRDGRKPLAEGKTDAAGNVEFQNLTAGLYLVTGELHKEENVSYEPLPVLVSLPNLNADDTWNYAPVISPKYEKQEQETVSCKVTKRWVDTGNTSSRPASVTAQLLRDGEVYAEVKLTKDNQWTHTWKDLENGHKWTVTEKTVAQSYTVKTEKSGTNFVITNTYKKAAPAPTPGDSKTGSGTSGGVEVKLPQTGQLWWPVPYMLLAGLLLICLGVLRRKRES